MVCHPPHSGYLRAYSGKMRRSIVKHIRTSICDYRLAAVLEACIDSMLRQHFLRKRMVKDGMAGFELR